MAGETYLGHVVSHDADTLALIAKLEDVASGYGLQRAQRALAAALWRSTQRHPSLQACVDMDPVKLIITEGGRRIRLELEVFPPTHLDTEGRRL